MTYQRQHFQPGDVLTAAALNEMDSVIERIENDLYDTKIDSTYSLVSQTCDVAAPPYASYYNWSTFSGWWAVIGKPTHIDTIKFPIAAREGTEISGGSITIYEFPDESELTFSSTGPSPRPNNWTVLGSKTFSLTIPVTDSAIDTVIQVDFDSRINNTNNKYLMAHIDFPLIVTLGILNVTYDDIPYDPSLYYSESGHSGCSIITGTYDKDNKTVKCLPVEIYARTDSAPYQTIGTSPSDKFFGLVNDCINNSESFSSLFDKRRIAEYEVGSQNLVLSKTTTTYDQWGTFSGACFYIGEVPDTYQSDGVAFSIYSRSYNSSTTPITKVWAYLYAVDSVPIRGTSVPSFNSLNPILLCTGEAEVNIAPGSQEIVNIYWDSPFANTTGKKLMLGYNTNSYSSRNWAGTSSTPEEVIGKIDGNTYENGTFYSYYTTALTQNSSNWATGWTDDSPNAWCFIRAGEAYDFGDKFYSILDEVIEETVGSTQVQTAPTSEVRLAASYDVVVGDTFQLFYSGVVKSFNYLGEGIRVLCPVGKQYKRYYEFTPTAEHAGKTYTLTLSTRRLDGSIISSGTTQIIVHPKLTNSTTPSNFNMLCFGDSLTGNGTWCAEGLRRIYGTATSGYSGPDSIGVTNSCTTYGSKQNTINTYVINHEGYGGWTWGSFLQTTTSSSTTSGIVCVFDTAHNLTLVDVQKSVWTDNNGLLWELEEFPTDKSIKFNRGTNNNGAQSTITVPTTLTCSSPSMVLTPSTVNWESSNPFYNPISGELDFAYHAEQNNNAGADIIAVLLTWNGGGGTADFDASTGITRNMNQAQTLLRQVHEDLPNAKIIVMGIQISDLNGGCGAAYGATGTYSDTWATAFYAFDYDRALEELVTNDEFGQYCYYIDTKGQFDSEYNMPANYKAVNVRNKGITELVGANGVHPYNGYDTNGYGYYQIGDAFYRALTKVIPTLIES